MDEQRTEREGGIAYHNRDLDSEAILSPHTSDHHDAGYGSAGGDCLRQTRLTTRKYRKLRIVGDDPGSGNVRQYSVKDLLLTTAYAASGMWCAMYFVRMVDTDMSRLVAALGCMFALFGAAFLTPFKRTLMGAAIGLAIFLFLTLVALTS